MSQEERDVLEMALVGYEAQRQNAMAKLGQIHERINAVRLKLGKPPLGMTPRRCSQEHKDKISAGQKKRWADRRAQNPPLVRSGLADLSTETETGTSLKAAVC